MKEKIEEILKRNDKTFDKEYPLDADLLQELTTLYTEMIEKELKKLSELEPPAELDPTVYKWWINKYLLERNEE